MTRTAARPRTTFVLLALLATALLVAACGSDDETTSTPAASTPAATTATSAAGTIVDVAAANPDLSTLVAAVTQANLVETLSGPGPFTVLAPTNEAFAAALTKLGLTQEELLASPLLPEILTYHVISGSVDSAAITASPTAKTVQGEDVAVAAADGKVTVNGANVVAADVETSNGIVHVIDQVLLPPVAAKSLTAATAAQGSIIDVASGNPDVSTLVAAVKQANLVDTLSGPGPFTVLAPTNEAFAAALSELNLTPEQLLASPDLAAILTYHVLAGRLDSTAIAGETSALTVQGEEITITSAGGGVKLNNSADVTTPDLAAENGIVHVIDRVLLPPTIAEKLGA